MEIILQEDVSSLGRAGDVVNVKPGYARNYLLPQKKAVLANLGNMNTLAHFKKVAASKQAKLKVAAQELAQSLAKVIVNLTAEVGEEGKLFGSITASDIVAVVREQGVTITKTQLQLKGHIKQVGNYTIDVKLHSDVIVPLQVNVVAKG